MSLLLTVSMVLDTEFAHFCILRLEGAGIFVLKHSFLTLLGPICVLLRPSPTLVVAAVFLPFPFLSHRKGCTSAIHIHSDHI